MQKDFAIGTQSLSAVKQPRNEMTKRGVATDILKNVTTGVSVGTKGGKRKRKGSLTEEINPRADFGWGKGKGCLLGEKVGNQ
ncbi:hypothetical protein CDAR_485241 [Caerostris darwini]|uniref:Uncharacterized protein n=1 Tax=Caerostris darwini TaxID=1538125 RepID=A0AAV4PC50_9ARAC|nr:hypothetical protein CDAR_485241 [Caerostris darwini]